MDSDLFPCYLVDKDSGGQVRGTLSDVSNDDLPPGEVLIEVHWSSLNYKDALAATGHPAVAPNFPHVPGIDAAGVVLQSDEPSISPGDEVVITGHELGAPLWGGWSKRIRVPSHWIVPLPKGLSLEESMILGTAGFTAAQCVMALERNKIDPDRGEVLVTGATGGVGSIAIKLLNHLGYSVVAATGKADATDYLRQLGATRIISRDDLQDDSKRPLLSVRWAAAVDTVGGATLANIVRQLDHRGCVAACGLVGGDNLPLTVYPFIIRGVTLAGIDSANCPRGPREEIWQRLAGCWHLDDLPSMATTINLDEVAPYVEKILAGQITGRTLIRI